jgi:ABC-type glutathione transport system ATPase component
MTNLSLTEAVTARRATPTSLKDRVMRLTVKYPFLPRTRSIATGMVMDAFGIDFDQEEHTITEDLELPLQPGQIALFSGPSGCGKSSLLRAAVAGLRALDHHRIITLGDIQLPDRPLVDALDLPVPDALKLLSACGLGEAHLFLRSPTELSEGQRYRFQIAAGLASIVSASRGAASANWLVADEFTSSLDRTTAQVLAFNLSRQARKLGVGCLLATTHEDVAADLAPDLWVRPNLDGRMAVEETARALRGFHPQAPANRRISFFPPAGRRRDAGPTGASSPAGIIAAMPSDRCAASSSFAMKTGPSASASLPRRH